MRSTFSVLFYTKNQSLKDGRVPIMGRITINRTTACFSCKLEVSLALWDAKANRAKGKSDEARRLNQKLDHIKAQITRHYQYICDHDSLVTAKSVYNRYLGFGDSYHTLMGLFREELASYKEKVGKEKAASTYRGLVADYNNLLLFLKEKRRIEDIAIADLDKKFIEDYYNWMLGTCALASSTAFCRVNTLKWLMYTAQERGWIKLHPFIGFDCLPEYKRRSFLTEEDLQRVIHVKLNYKRQRAIRDMFLFMCFTGLAYADLKEITYKNMRQGMQTIHRRSKGLLEFVENYRKLTRLPAPVRRPVAVRELLQDLQKLFSEEYIRIELPETDRILQIDRTQIEQVLINLIKNAKEACSRKEHPRIEVKMLPALSWQCLITVNDNGEGILPEVQDKIFVPFFTTKPSGSGIGLSLCKQVMNRHGGNITVQSTVGKGSCFTLLFG